jgi:hypothetical protein
MPLQTLINSIYSNAASNHPLVYKFFVMTFNKLVLNLTFSCHSIPKVQNCHRISFSLGFEFTCHTQHPKK